jgi:hypothetical protein
MKLDYGQIVNIPYIINSLAVETECCGQESRTISSPENPTEKLKL